MTKKEGHGNGDYMTKKEGHGKIEIEIFVRSGVCQP